MDVLGIAGRLYVGRERGIFPLLPTKMLFGHLSFLLGSNG